MKKGLVLFVAVAVLFLVGVSLASAEVVRGKVTAIDLGTNKLSVQTSSGEALALSFDKEDFIVWKGDDEVEAKEIQTGSEAEVGYYAVEKGGKVASWVDLTPVEETAEPEAPSGEMGTEAAQPEAPVMEQPATTQSAPTTEEPASKE